LSPNRLKHQQISAKAKAIREELARLDAQPRRATRPQLRDEFFDHSDTRETENLYDFEPKPMASQDPELMNGLFGPQFCTLQYEACDPAIREEIRAMRIALERMAK
jgi:hypothetical protein